MSREAISLTIPDTAAFARALRTRLAASPTPPGHQEMLGHIAAAAGFRNWQHLVAVQAGPAPAAPADPAALRRAERAGHVFDTAGRMKHWPAQTALQALCLWVLWARLPAGQDIPERDLNDRLRAWTTFGDHVLVRRSLIDHRMVSRTQDNMLYRRIEQPPPEEARALIRRLAP